MAALPPPPSRPQGGPPPGPPMHRGPPPVGPRPVPSHPPGHPNAPAYAPPAQAQRPASVSMEPPNASPVRPDQTAPSLSPVRLSGAPSTPPSASRLAPPQRPGASVPPHATGSSPPPSGVRPPQSQGSSPPPPPPGARPTGPASPPRGPRPTTDESPSQRPATPTRTPRRTASPLRPGERPQIPRSRAGDDPTPRTARPPMLSPPAPQQQHQQQQQSLPPPPQQQAQPPHQQTPPPPSVVADFGPMVRESSPEAGLDDTTRSLPRRRGMSLLDDPHLEQRPRSLSRQNSVQRPPPPARKGSMHEPHREVADGDLVPASEALALSQSARSPRPSTLLEISAASGVPLDQIRRFNPDLDGFAANQPLPTGTHVKVPKLSTLDTTIAQVTAAARDAEHPPETLAGIALRANVPVETVQKLNPHLDAYDPHRDVLPVGTTVHIPATKALYATTPTVDQLTGRPAGLATPSTSAVRAERSQTGEDGESILDVARNTNTSVADILAWNPNLEGYPLDKPLPHLRLNLPEEPTPENARSAPATASAVRMIPPPPPSSSRTGPQEPATNPSLTCLAEIAAHYDANLADIRDDNGDLVAQYGATRPLPPQTLVQVRAPKHNLGQPFTFLVTSSGSSSQVGGKSRAIPPPPPKAPLRRVGSDADTPPTAAPAAGPQPPSADHTTLADIAAMHSTTVDTIRTCATLASHTEVAAQCGVSLWALDAAAHLPERAALQLLRSSSAAVTPNTTLAAAAAREQVSAEVLRQCNPRLPAAYPADRPLPVDVRLELPTVAQPAAASRSVESERDMYAEKEQDAGPGRGGPALRRAEGDTSLPPEAVAIMNERDFKSESASRDPSMQPLRAAPAPAPTTTSSAPTGTATASSRVLSEAGDTLAAVARRHGLDPIDLYCLNPNVVDDEMDVYEEELAEGTVIRLPPGAATSAAGALQNTRALPAARGPVPAASHPEESGLNTDRSSDGATTTVKPRSPSPGSQGAPTPNLSPPTASSAPAAAPTHRQLHNISTTALVPTPRPAHGQITEADMPDEDAAVGGLPTRTVLATGTDTVRALCDEHFLTEDQLRAMNPFLARYHSHTIVPRNTLVVLETVDSANAASAARQRALRARTRNPNFGEMLDGRRVFVVRSPTRSRPHASVSSPRSIGGGREVSPARYGNSSIVDPRSVYAADADDILLPLNTLADIAEHSGIPEDVLRRRNPALRVVASSDPLPNLTLVELDAGMSDASSSAVALSNLSASHVPRPLSPAKDRLFAGYVSQSGAQRGLNRRAVVRAMGHKAAVLLGQRFFDRWRLFATLYNSSRLREDVARENEHEHLRTQIEAGKATEADLRRRVAELRMALDCSRPAAAGSTSPDRRRSGGSPQAGAHSHHLSDHNLSNLSLVAWKQQQQVLSPAAAAHLTYSESLSPNRRVLQLASAPPVVETRFPRDASREVGGTTPMRGHSRHGSPLRDATAAFAATGPLRRASPLKSFASEDHDRSALLAQSTTRAASTAAPQAAGRRSLGLLLNGLRVSRVTGAAAAAGIQQNDQVVRVDGALVSSGSTFRQLVDRCSGPKISLTLQTPTGHVFTTMLPLVEAPASPAAAVSAADGLRSPSTGRRALAASPAGGASPTSEGRSLLSSPYRRPVKAPKGAYQPRY